MTVWRPLLAAAVAVFVSVHAILSAAAQQTPAPRLDQLEHIVVIYLENHSFDNLFGRFPGANGLAEAGERALQVDKDGKPYDMLPLVVDDTWLHRPDRHFPAELPNKPFLIDKYLPLNARTPSPTHLYYDQILEIDGGKMDKFVAYGGVGGFVMGYQDGSKLALWQYARDYTLADNFFHAAFGGSFLNHFWAICACTPRFENAPDAIRAKLDAKGNLVRNGAVTPDGWAVNTLEPAYQPHPADADPRHLLPPQRARTIGDALSEKKVSWAWYAGGWNDALAGRADPAFQYHHQPFAYFERYGDGTAARREHLKDEADLVADIKRGTLPAVAFWKPIGTLDEHPGYTDTRSGDAHMAAMIEMIRKSPLWRSTAIIVTYDENGGFWDHVAPPRIDRWGPGMRVPTVIISPFAKRHYVDHTFYDTTSILRFIERRYDLSPLAERDAKANDLMNAFRFQD